MINQIISVIGLMIGALYILFLPGWMISFTFFEREKIDAIERVALSFALSIAVVPLVVFYLSLAGVKITTLNAVLEVATITLMAFGGAAWRSKRQKAPKAHGETKSRPASSSPASVPTRRITIDGVNIQRRAAIEANQTKKPRARL